MPPGRPRKYDLVEEAKKLDDWSKKENSFSLYEFTDDKDYLAQELSRFADECYEFSLALKKAKERISLRREKAVNKNEFNYGIWNRNARVYDNLLKNSEDKDKDEDVKRKQLIEQTKPQQILINVKSDGLAAGLNISAEAIPALTNQSSQ